MPPYIPLHNLWWLAAGGASYGARYVKQRWGAARQAARVRPAHDPTGELLRWQAVYGYNPHSLVSIAPGALLWSSPVTDGAVIYSKFGRVWLAAGDPLAPFDEIGELAHRFTLAAREKNRIAAFVPTTEHFARDAVKHKMSAMKVGAAPYFDLQTWSPRGDRAKKMRAGVNQARRAGVAVEAIETVNESLQRETALLCLRWLETRRAQTSFGWLLALDPFLHAERKRFFAARDGGGQLVGFLAASPIPARDGWYLEDVLRLPSAPQGSADLLVVEALTKLSEAGAKLATLGTSPLATDGDDSISTGDHPLVERALRVAASRLDAFYNFDGLRRFKAKFVPTWWESEYVLAPRGVMMPPHVTHAILRAIAPGGLTQLLTRKVWRMIHPKRPTRNLASRN